MRKIRDSYHYLILAILILGKINPILGFHIDYISLTFNCQDFMVSNL